MALYILDTDATQANGTTIFSVWSQLMSKALADLGTTNSQPVEIHLKASTGLPFNQQLLVNSFLSSITNNITITAKNVNGNPFIIDETGLTTSNLCDLNDDYITLQGENLGDLIINADVAATTTRIMVYCAKATAMVRNVIINGKGSTNHAGMYAPVSSGRVDFDNVIFNNCRRQFYGACRGYGHFNKCTFKDNLVLRGAASLRNSIIINTSFTSAEGINGGALTDNNIYDIPKTSVVYLGDSSLADVNSIFSINASTDLLSREDGGYDILSISPAATLMTTAGQIGAGTVIQSGNIAPVIADQTLNVILDTDLIIELSNYASDANGDTLTYSMTGDAGIRAGATGSQFIFNSSVLGSHPTTVTIDDGNGGTDTAVFTIVVNTPETQPTKVMGIGNSLSQRPAGDPSGVTNSVYDEVTEMLNDTGKGGLFTFTEYLYGGRQLDDHAADAALMADIPNHDLLLIQGYGSTANYATDLPPITDLASHAAVWLLWEAAGAPGEYAWVKPNITDAATAAGSDLIELGDVWQWLRANTSLDLFYDTTHQNLNGSYVNALCIYRYLTGESVANVNYTPALLTLSAGDITTIKTAVDTYIAQQYVAVVRTATVTITASTASILQGQAASFSATATDDVSGDITASIQWFDDLGNPLGTGGTITQVMNVSGSRVVIAKVTGSDALIASASVPVTVTPLANTAPVASDVIFNVKYNEAFTQKSLVSYVTDDGALDWSTLVISQPSVGVSSIDVNSASTVNINYAGSGFLGTETFTFSVADSQGLRSNTATITVRVSRIITPTIAGNAITRGANKTISIDGIDLPQAAEVVIRNPATQAEYPCSVVNVAQASASVVDVVINPPVDMPAFTGAEVLVKPIVGYA